MSDNINDTIMLSDDDDAENQENYAKDAQDAKIDILVNRELCTDSNQPVSCITSYNVADKLLTIWFTFSGLFALKDTKVASSNRIINVTGHLTAAPRLEQARNVCCDIWVYSDLDLIVFGLGMDS